MIEKNLKEIAAICEGNPSLLNIMGLIMQFAQGSEQFLQRVKLLPVTVLEEKFEKSLSLSMRGSVVSKDLRKLKNQLKLKMEAEALMSDDQAVVNQVMSQQIKRMFSNVRIKKNH